MKKVTILVTLAIILRLVLAIFTHHPDLGAFALAGKYMVGEGKWLTFYDTVTTKDEFGKPKVNITDTVFNYQPLAYIIPAVFYLPFASIVNQTGSIVRDQKFVTQNPALFNFELLLYKYPMILADLALLWLIPKFFTDPKKKRLSLLLWAFNPVAIYVSSMIGQVDIFIALFITGGLYFYQKDRPFLSTLLIALSALIKPVGLILIPLLALHHYVSKKDLLRSFLLFFTGFGFYILGILPYLQSTSYRYYALYAEQLSKSTYAGISIAAGNDIPFFFIFYAVIALLIWYKKFSFRNAVGLALLSGLVFSHFHPQWLVWIMPWLIIQSVRTSDYFIYLLHLLCWLLILFSFDNTLHLQMFLHSRTSLPVVLTSSGYFKEVILMARAGLVACLLWFVWSPKENTTHD